VDAGGLIQRLAPAEPSSTAAPVHPHCLNCGTTLAGPTPRFCAACGQETHVKPPTLREFAQQFGGAYFATEGALWRTLKLLLFKPGELTRQYLAGRRKHHVLPLRLYLSISVLVLLAVRLIASADGQSPISVKINGKEGSNFSIGLGMGSAGLRNGVFFCNELPNWLCKRFQRRIDVQPEGMADAARQMGERFVSNVGGAMFLLLPSLALFCLWVYRSRRLRYTEHLVFALHLHAFWFLMFGLVLVPLDWVNGPALLAVPIYTGLAMRRVYGGRWWALMLRIGVVAVLYGVTLAFAMAGVFLWALLA
jgi:Protein of unknown function (DUF3667)